MWVKGFEDESILGRKNMANNLNQELTGKTVVLSSRYYRGDEAARTFRCESGFGCSSFTRGSAIYGRFVQDGEKARVEGGEIEKMAESPVTD